MEFFEFLFLNPICLLVGEAIEHNLFGNGCPIASWLRPTSCRISRSAAHVARSETLADDAFEAEPRAGTRRPQARRDARSVVGRAWRHAGAWRARPCGARLALGAGPCRLARSDRRHRGRRAGHLGAAGASGRLAAHSLAIYQAGAQSERVYRLDDEREVARPVVPVAGEQPDAGGVSPNHHAEAVVLDLVNPVGSAWGAVSG
jgi:hypothetical protein